MVRRKICGFSSLSGCIPLPVSHHVWIFFVENGVARINLQSNAFTLNGDYDITGRIVAVHSQRDDGGRGGTSTTGNSGAPRACGVIGINAERMDDNRGQRDNENRGQRNKENRGQQKDRNH